MSETLKSLLVTKIVFTSVIYLLHTLYNFSPIFLDNHACLPLYFELPILSADLYSFGGLNLIPALFYTFHLCCFYTLVVCLIQNVHFTCTSDNGVLLSMFCIVHLALSCSLFTEILFIASFILLHVCIS
jgi:hypothetical protein